VCPFPRMRIWAPTTHRVRACLDLALASHAKVGMPKNWRTIWSPASRHRLGVETEEADQKNSRVAIPWLLSKRSCPLWSTTKLLVRRAGASIQTAPKSLNHCNLCSQSEKSIVVRVEARIMIAF
jgi:hypothetical protein